MAVMLEKVTVQTASGIGKSLAVTNATRGSGTVDTRSKGLSGI